MHAWAVASPHSIETTCKVVKSAVEVPAGYYPVSLAFDAVTGVVVVKSLDGAVALYDECSGRQLARSGRQLARYAFGNPLHYPTETGWDSLATDGWTEPAVVIDRLTHTAIVAVTHGQLALFDLATHRLSAIIPVAKELTTLALDPLRGRVVATSFATGAVYTVDLRTRNVLGTVTVGGHPASIVLDRATGRAFVGNYLRAGVDVIDDRTSTEITRLPVAANKLTLDPTHRRLYTSVGAQTTGSLGYTRGPLAQTPPTKDRFAITVFDIDTLHTARTLHVKWTDGLAQYPTITLLSADAHTGDLLVALCDTGGFCVLDTFDAAGMLAHSGTVEYNYRLSVMDTTPVQVFPSYFYPRAVYNYQLPGGANLIDERTGHVVRHLTTDFAGVLAMGYDGDRHVLALAMGLWKILSGPPKYINDASALKLYYNV